MISAVQQAFPDLSPRQLCRWLGVSRSWYYACPSTEERAERDVALRAAIEDIILELLGYGYRRVTYALQRADWQVHHKQVLRVMRQESVLSQLKRRFVMTTDATHGYTTYPNLLAAITMTAPDQAWVADSTFVRLPHDLCLSGLSARGLLTALHRLEAFPTDRHAADAGRL